jgi:hypothetical protein
VTINEKWSENDSPDDHSFVLQQMKQTSVVCIFHLMWVPLQSVTSRATLSRRAFDSWMCCEDPIEGSTSMADERPAPPITLPIHAIATECEAKRPFMSDNIAVGQHFLVISTSTRWRGVHPSFFNCGFENDNRPLL